jgi:alkylhydroperoxidase family enzyme
VTRHRSAARSGPRHGAASDLSHPPAATCQPATKRHRASRCDRQRQIWQAAAEHYDEAQLGGLLLEIGSINVWNRLNAATHQLAGAYQV